MLKIDDEIDAMRARYLLPGSIIVFFCDYFLVQRPPMFFWIKVWFQWLHLSVISLLICCLNFFLFSSCFMSINYMCCVCLGNHSQIFQNRAYNNGSNSTWNSCPIVSYISRSWLYPRRSMETSRPFYRSTITFLAWFLLSNFNRGVQWFSGFYILKMWNFSVLNCVSAF